MYEPQYRSAYSDTATDWTILGLNPSSGQKFLRSSTVQSYSVAGILRGEVPEVIYTR